MNFKDIKDSLNEKINSLKTRSKQITISNIISIILWVLTFITLIVIIIIASCKDSINTIAYAYAISSMILLFSILLISSLMHIVIVKYIERKKQRNN